MNYQEALDYLANLAKFGFNFGLGRIQELLKRLNNPHLALKVIHIGGTNGKGSTSAMLSAILQEGGYRVGAFTSPHLKSYTERYRINGAEISGEQVAVLLDELRPHLEAMVAEGFEHPTEFEVGTALAFLYFNREKVDFLVVEVGMGGAIDSTNVVKPLLSIITNVSMDHMDYLGHTIEEITLVKAGIIKPGAPVVTAARGEALGVIESVCLDKKSPLYVVGRDLSWQPAAWNLSGQEFSLRGRRKYYEKLFIPLLGRHQLVNAATAVAAAEVLMDLGVSLNGDVVRLGLARTRWPGRMEIVSQKPLVIIDGAHNYDGARCLRQALEEYFPGRSIVMVIGMLGDKERALVAAELAGVARAVVVTRPDNPRASNWRELAEEVRNYTSEVYLLEDTGEAVRKALALAGPEEVILVTGSLYMVGGAREVILAQS
ncbi:MAG TPA: bifunctional folylpolyglutamate synthase/dihydrofolate synthase [Peptococcaceae bacterium]|uniref:tetrahydrofolate synthase n=1 Tax=anaerobic digester metagenome TaxID=1263854 RepID=A0A485LUN0_9ZZZZ|nr:folylpolyglutamate synthase/dihydrofolate synthase family protein [Bacillota bacterium]HHU87512.1 bifunctional folylpolyglutamate synthase/dihydrofolate synthase [Peptococcaceae bacterium]